MYSELTPTLSQNFNSKSVIVNKSSIVSWSPSLFGIPPINSHWVLVKNPLSSGLAINKLSLNSLLKTINNKSIIGGNNPKKDDPPTNTDVNEIEQQINNHQAEIDILENELANAKLHAQELSNNNPISNKQDENTSLPNTTQETNYLQNITDSSDTSINNVSTKKINTK